MAQWCGQEMACVGPVLRHTRSRASEPMKGTSFLGSLHDQGLHSLTAAVWLSEHECVCQPRRPRAVGVWQREKVIKREVGR